jgi:hypothetical protein
MLRVLLLSSLLSTSALSAVPDGFSRILVPLAYPSTPGAYGSVWSTDLILYNASPVTLDIGTDIWPISSSCPPVPANRVFPPNTFTDTCQNRSTAARTDLLYVRSDVADDILFSLRIRESSAGIPEHTEVPVVRDEDLLDGSIYLARVPATTESFRSMIRIYDPSARPSTVTVRLWQEWPAGAYPPGTEPGPDPVAQKTVTLAPLDLADVPLHPSYAEVFLDERSFPGTELRGSYFVEILAETQSTPFWAMATITDNVKQTVNVILPQ